VPEGSLQKTCRTNILHVPVVLSRIERRTGLHGPSEAIWMQTSGTSLVAAERCSLLRMWMLAEGGRSACRLLYSAAVQRSSHLGRDHLIRRQCHAHPLPAHFTADLPRCYSLVRSRRQR
jgi:hypothetical protein